MTNRKKLYSDAVFCGFVRYISKTKQKDDEKNMLISNDVALVDGGNILQSE